MGRRDQEKQMATHICNHAMHHDERSAYGDADGYHVVDTADLVQIAGQGPRGRIGVVRLDVGTAPGAVAVAVAKDFTVAVDDRGHDGVVDEAAEDGAVHLREEHDSRRDLQILAHFKICRQIHGVGDDVVGPGREVHVANGPLRDHQASKHLAE
jgi:hypothetical protein